MASTNFRLWEHQQVIDLLQPATDAAGRTSAYINPRNGYKAYIVVKLAQGNAATVLLSVLQATDSSGTGSKAVTAMPIVSNLDTSTSDALVVRTNAATYTTDAALKNKIVIFEIDPAQCMDINNGFNHVAVSTGASNAANLTEATLILAPIKFKQATPPSTVGI